MMAQVPYTRTDTLTDADREYLAVRVSNGPAVAQLLGMGEIVTNQRQLVERLDLDTGLADSAVTTGNNADSYSQAVLDEPSDVN